MANRLSSKSHSLSHPALTAKSRSQRSLMPSSTKRHFGKRCTEMSHSRVRLVHFPLNLSRPSSGRFSKLGSSQSYGRHHPCAHFQVLRSTLTKTQNLLNLSLGGGSSCSNRAEDSCCMMSILRRGSIHSRFCGNMRQRYQTGMLNQSYPQRDAVWCTCC